MTIGEEGEEEDEEWRKESDNGECIIPEWDGVKL